MTKCAICGGAGYESHRQDGVPVNVEFRRIDGTTMELCAGCIIRCLQDGNLDKLPKMEPAEEAIIKNAELVALFVDSVYGFVLINEQMPKDRQEEFAKRFGELIKDMSESAIPKQKPKIFRKCPPPPLFEISKVHKLKFGGDDD